MGFHVGIDSGGTFTDLQAIDESGQSHIIKVPSTPDDPSIGFRDALAALVERLNGASDNIDVILHGTTVAVNAILQRKFPPIGLLVTRGFRHILELARQTVPGERGSIYVWVKPPRIVYLGNVREVTERLDFKGGVMTPLDEGECREAAQWYREQGITTVAICFINAYANGAHERRVSEIFREEYPECFVSISSEILPEYREYERAMTTCMNALLMPILGAYVSNLSDHIKELGITAPLYMMKSGGGASRADLAIEKPVFTALSGPAAAVVGSAWIGRSAGFEDLITFDMGGTSTDVSLIENGHPALISEVEVDGYPIRTQSIDVVSVGAGGGSIAWLAPGDRLSVGPRSAGADPGPACYGRGGVEPTITDADFYLGRLSDSLAGGSVTLERNRAEDALSTLGEKLGLSSLELAHGVLEIGELNMADAIRRVSVQKGRDPRLFNLIASGGAGPLHAGRLAENLHIPTVIIPPSPGIGCSLGALVSDVREDFVLTRIHREDDADFDLIRTDFGELEAKAVEALERQGFSAGTYEIIRSADLRYKGMRTELTVAVQSGPLDEDAISGMFDALHAAHESAYGYSYAGVQQVELVNLRVAGLGRMRGVPPYEPPVASGSAVDAMTGTRQVYFGEAGWIETNLYDRAKLPRSSTFSGPAIVEQYDCTTVIFPNHSARVDDHGNLLVTIQVTQELSESIEAEVSNR